MALLSGMIHRPETSIQTASFETLFQTPKNFETKLFPLGYPRQVIHKVIRDELCIIWIADEALTLQLMIHTSVCPT